MILLYFKTSKQTQNKNILQNKNNTILEKIMKNQRLHYIFWKILEKLNTLDILSNFEKKTITLDISENVEEKNDYSK